MAYSIWSHDFTKDFSSAVILEKDQCQPRNNNIGSTCVFRVNSKENILVGSIVQSCLFSCFSKKAFNDSLQDEVKNIALFDREEDVMNLNRQFFEKVERNGYYITSPYHQSNTVESLRFASNVMINDEESWKSHTEQLKRDGTH